MERRIKNLEYVSKAIRKALLLRLIRENSLVLEILSKVKNDRNFFDEFFLFLERTLGKRDTLLLILKRKIVEKCVEVYNDLYQTD